MRSPKRTRSSPTGVPENGSERQELEPSLQERRQHADAPSAPLAVAPVSPLQPLHNSQQSSPRTVSEREESPHQQSPRRPVIVCGADLAKSSDVRPLLKQLTSGGELEVTLSTPSASSASSDSGIVSLSSHRTSSDAGQPDVTHISVKPVNTGNRQQYAEGSPHDAPQHHFASSKRISYTVEQLSQPHQSAQSIFPPREHVPVSLWNGEPPWWQHGKWPHVASFVSFQDGGQQIVLYIALKESVIATFFLCGTSPCDIVTVNWVVKTELR